MPGFETVLHRFAEVTSTNDEARRLAEEGAPEGTVVWADHQTAGRGRYGRAWHSSDAQNVLLSIVLRPRLSPDRLGLLTMAGAVAVTDAVLDVAGLSTQIKWPNDILIGGRKLCGMLLESSSDLSSGQAPRSVILGIGVNVNQREFPADIAGRATSLRRETGRPVQRGNLVERLMSAFGVAYRGLHSDGGSRVHREFVSRMQGLHQTCRVWLHPGDKTCEGIVAGVAPDGGLEIEMIDGSTRVLYAGEVTLTPLEGTEHAS